MRRRRSDEEGAPSYERRRVGEAAGTNSTAQAPTDKRTTDETDSDHSRKGKRRRSRIFL